jgi:F-type H+-transporting ATPase subunit a
MDAVPASAPGALESLPDVVIRIPSDVVFVLFGLLPVTNTLLSSWLAMALLILVAALTTRRLRDAPAGLQNAWEALCEAWIAIVDRSIGPRGRRYIPLLGASFLFVLTANWLGTLPLKHLKIEAPDGREVALFRPATSDLNLTLAMAIFVIALVEVTEIRAVGLRPYLRALVLPNPFRLLELVARPLSLALRLFGNIFAGDVLVGMFLAIAPVILFLVLGLELFVGLVQAVIFAALMLVFLSVAITHEPAGAAAVEARARPTAMPTSADTALSAHGAASPPESHLPQTGRARADAGST